MNMTSTPLGDMHNGRQTCLIQTDTETYIVKPRSSKTEEAFDAFCHKLEGLGFDAFARAPYVLQKGEHEHTERVEVNRQTDENGAHRYYQRAGVLLFFTYLLGSTDLHCENLIADGDMPVLIDLETLLTGHPRGAGERYNLSRSVMRSHLLCNFVGNTDVSGFSGVKAQHKNIPHTAQGKVFLWEERDAFLDGFEKAYRLALAHKEEIAVSIHLFDRCEFRQILRPTETYAVVSLVLSKLEGHRQDHVTALLSKAYERDNDQDRIEKAKLVLRQETEAVLNGEIPLFYTYGNDTALYGNGRKLLDDHLSLSPVAYALTKLDGLSERDLARQRKLIELAIDASTPLDKPQTTVYISTDALSAGERAASSVSACEVDGIDSVFCGLQQDRNGAVNFVSCGYSLYQGLCGVLCMYAALFRKTGKRVYADCLYRYYERVRKVFFGNDRRIILTDANASLADGVLGVVSCLDHIGRLIQDDAFLHDAKTLVGRLVLSENIRNTDYLNGIGSLPLVFRRFGIDPPSSLVTLFEKTQPFITGIAHGSSGLALSLCALDTTGNSDKKILSLLEWENKHFSAQDHNWFDLRDKTKKGFMSGWCSGAPGIGVARQYIRNNTDNETLKRLCDVDIEHVRVFLSKRTACKKDTLCCGSSSVLMAASILGVAADGMYARLCAAEKNDQLRVTHIANTSDINVSLMQGLAGVAYTLAMYGDPLCGGMLL